MIPLKKQKPAKSSPAGLCHRLNLPGKGYRHPWRRSSPKKSSGALLSALTTFVLACAFAAFGSSAGAFESKAKQAIVMDYTTGAIIYAKNADAPMAPASLTKIMTAYMVFEALADGTLRLDDRLSVSEKAWRKGGSKMFLEVGQDVTVDDLLRGIIIQSGNDACIVVAEALSGSEDTFATDMTNKARALGLETTVFRNASGWPDPEHASTARDVARLVYATLRDFPQYYSYYAETHFTYSGIRQMNRNPLLHSNVDGVDGLKTGHTQDSGYGLAASAKRGDRRLIMVINGLDSKSARAKEGKKLLEWAFRNFDNYHVYDAGQAIAQVPTWLSDKPQIPLVLAEDFILTLPRSTWKKAVIRLRYPSILRPPLAIDDKVGTVDIEDAEGRVIASRPLLVGDTAEPLALPARIPRLFSYLLWGTM